MKNIVVLILALTIFSCKSDSQTITSTQDPQKEIKFDLISIPDSLTDVEARGDYFLAHYWDNFPFADTAYVDVPKVSEQAYVDFLDVLPHMPLEKSIASIENMMTKAEADPMMFDYFVQLAEKYLYHPNSPFRNEDYFIAVLRSEVNSKILSQEEKIRPEYQLSMALKNRVGEGAEDFVYTLGNGKQSTLYGIKADYTLLYFSNPECPNCIQIKEQILSSSKLSEMLTSGKLKILSLYIDEDLDLWRKHISEYPKQWINAYDKSTIISKKDLYDLRAIPTMYLLDNNKKVILKDPTFEQLEGFTF